MNVSTPRGLKDYLFAHIGGVFESLILRAEVSSSFRDAVLWKNAFGSPEEFRVLKLLTGVCVCGWATLPLPCPLERC